MLRKQAFPRAFSWMLAACFLFAACLLLASCAKEAPADSGITGHVVSAPSKSAGVSPSPSVKPFADAVIIVRDGKGGKEIAKGKPDSQGAFKITLPAGTYFVDPVNGSGTVIPWAPPQTVEVKQGAFTDITVTFDLGGK